MTAADGNNGTDGRQTCAESAWFRLFRHLSVVGVLRPGPEPCTLTHRQAAAPPANISQRLVTEPMVRACIDSLRATEQQFEAPTL